MKATRRAGRSCRSLWLGRSSCCTIETTIGRRVLAAKRQSNRGIEDDITDLGGLPHLPALTELYLHTDLFCHKILDDDELPWEPNMFQRGSSPPLMATCDIVRLLIQSFYLHYDTSTRLQLALTTGVVKIMLSAFCSEVKLLH